MNKEQIPAGEPWHTLSIQNILRKLEVRPEMGLTDQEVWQRRSQSETNEEYRLTKAKLTFLPSKSLTTPILIFLFGSLILSSLFDETASLLVIFAVMVLYITIVVVQLYQTDRAFALLVLPGQRSPSSVNVRRSECMQRIPTSELVPGDIILLDAGDKVPADARLLEAQNLRVQEASLTGESYPVDKFHDSASIDKPGERQNMVYMGTVITYGKGTAVIVEIGTQTELGRLAHYAAH